ncbi:MAG: PEP-utilizing enzyme, partial [Pseudomonadota bacterium]
MTEACTMSGIGVIGLDGPAPDPARHGEKAALLAAGAAAGLPVPPALALPPGFTGDIAPLLSRLEAATGARLGGAEAPLLLSVRPSPIGTAGAQAPAVLDLGLTQAAFPALAARLGERTARDVHRRLLHSYGTGVLELEGDDFEYALHDALRLAGRESETDLDAGQLAALSKTYLGLIADEAEEPFPDDAMAQVAGAVAALPRIWNSRRARLRRQALGGDPDAPLALIIQVMALGLGPRGGAGFADLRDEATGRRALSGRYLPDAQGDDALMGLRTPMVLTTAERDAMGLSGAALEDREPDAIAALRAAADVLENAIGDAVSLEFTIEDGAPKILEVKRARRSARAAIRIAVDLAEAGAITRHAALMRVDPGHLEEQLHPAIDPDAPRKVVGQGLPASPGAVSGPLVFTPDAAEVAEARGVQTILALIETSPEDIRGMHAAGGVLTVRGGMTSHAAVVARGLGKPCIVGARDLSLDRADGTLRTADGRNLQQGDIVTVDGTTGQVLAGEVAMIQPETSGAFATLMGWADEVRRLGVRANADTGEDAATARGFGACGIGLCRT